MPTTKPNKKMLKKVQRICNSHNVTEALHDLRLVLKETKLPLDTNQRCVDKGLGNYSVVVHTTLIKERTLLTTVVKNLTKYIKQLKHIKSIMKAKAPLLGISSDGSIDPTHHTLPSDKQIKECTHASQAFKRLTIEMHSVGLYFHTAAIHKRRAVNIALETAIKNLTPAQVPHGGSEDSSSETSSSGVSSDEAISSGDASDAPSTSPESGSGASSSDDARVSGSGSVSQDASGDHQSSDDTSGSSSDHAHSHDSASESTSSDASGSDDNSSEDSASDVSSSSHGHSGSDDQSASTSSDDDSHSHEGSEDDDDDSDSDSHHESDSHHGESDSHHDPLGLHSISHRGNTVLSAKGSWKIKMSADHHIQHHHAHHVQHHHQHHHVHHHEHHDKHPADKHSKSSDDDSSESASAPHGSRRVRRSAMSSTTKSGDQHQHGKRSSTKHHPLQQCLNLRNKLPAL